MKKIQIFLASSITEFATERMEVENFIRNVSDEFEEKYNVKLKPFLCEHIDPAYTIGRKQEEYNEIIRGCDFCFFIFFTKVGQYTREEFEVARTQFESCGKPKIYTYFKEVAEGEAEQSLRDFVTELDQVLRHYYSTFSHIDTVKLRILLSIKLQEMDFLEIKAEDGHCVVDGQQVLPLANVAEFANNQQLAEMQRELAKLEEEYFALKAQYHSRVGDAAFYSHYSQVASRRQTLMNEIAELQGLIFNMSLQMVRDDAHGEITPRQKKAYQLFEQGDYEGCMAVLDAADIDGDFLAQLQHEEEQHRKKKETLCRRYIREHKTAIDILLTMKQYEGRFAEVEQRYEKILPVIFEMGIELDAALDYVKFLRDQNKGVKAIPIAQQLLELYPEDADKAHILYLLGVFYYQSNMPQKDEEVILRAIAIYEGLAAENPERYNPDLARIYNSAGVFYDDQRDADKAEAFYVKAIAIREALAAENPERYNADLAQSYNNAGIFYKNQNQPDKAAEFLHKAIAIREALAAENPERFNPDLAQSYNSAGNLYQDLKKYDKAEEFYLKSIAIREALVAENPDRFNPVLASSYNNAGNLYYDLKKYDKAEAFHLKAIAIREALAAKNPERFNPDLAQSYNNVGNLYSNLKKYDKAEEFCLKAIAIRETLAAENPERYNPVLASSYNNIGVFYDDQGDADKAEVFYLKAIAIRETLAAENPERFNPDLAQSYNNIGVFYDDQGDADKAEVFYLKAIAIREALAAENPDRFNPVLASSYRNAGLYYHKQREYDKADFFRSKAYSLYGALAEKQPQAYLSYVQELLPRIKSRQNPVKI